MTDLIDKIVCGYRILSEIGEGGMGKVYLAESAFLTEYKQQVAVKTLTSKNEKQALLLQDLFIREANIQVQLKHPHIVSVIQFAIEHDAHFLLLEYVPGYEHRGRRMTNVADVLRYETGAMNYQRALKLFVQALDAMDYAHNFKYRWEGEERVGIVHRDIKPGNMLMADANTIKISDFGIVKVQQRRESATSRLTPGTSAYMAPEAILGPHHFGLLELDGRSDIYALGITLYEMLTGRLPFKIETGVNPDVSIRRQQVEDMPAPPSAIYPQLPPQLDDLVMRALQKNPDRRYQSARDFKEALLALNTTLQLGLPTKTSSYNTNLLGDSANTLFSAPTNPQGGLATDQGWRDAAKPTRALRPDANTMPRGWNPTPVPETTTGGALPNTTGGAHHLTGDDSHATTLSPVPTGLDSRVLSDSQVTTLVPPLVPQPAEEPAPKSKTPLLALGAIAAVLAVLAFVFLPKLLKGNSGTSNGTNPAVSPTAALPQTPVDMVSIPAGSFLMGRDLDDAMKDFTITNGNQQEKVFQHDFPSHPEEVKAFYLAKTEVSRRSYAAFVKATGRTAPSDWGAPMPPANTEEQPVTFVSYADATDYCAWLTEQRKDGLLYRLPTEAEWEYAARGPDAGQPGKPVNLYPWGDEWTPGYANTRESRLAHPQNVTANTQAKSPFAVLNLSGNVYEWTATDFQHYIGNDRSTPREAGYQGTYQVVRGGSFDFPKEYAMTTTRVWAKPTSLGPRLGFRCAAEVRR